MVTLKSSFPQLHSSFSTTESPAIDSADLPPIPHPPRESNTFQAVASYLDNDNPWKEPASTQPGPGQQLSASSLAPGNGKHVESVPESQQALHTSPAALKLAPSGRDTPRSSIDSEESRDFWEDDDGLENASPTSKSQYSESAHAYGNYNDWSHVETPPVPTQLPPPPPSSTSNVKRKPIAAPAYPPPQPPAESHPSDFASLNPFRRPLSPQIVPERPVLQPTQRSLNPYSEDVASTGKGKQPVRDAVHVDGTVTQLSNLHLSYSQGAEQPLENPWKPLEPTSLPPPPPAAQSEKIPVSIGPLTDEKELLSDPWASAPQPLPSHSSFNHSQKHFTQYTDGLLDRGSDVGPVSLSDEPEWLPHASTGSQTKSAEPSLLDDDDEAPSLPRRPADQLSEKHSESYEPLAGATPSKGPKPTAQPRPLSEAEIAKNIEDRSETYQIKHFNWFDHNSGRLRSSSMLVQNKNGPCPLLALVNALILGAREESQAALDDALRSREQVSIGLIIETLMYELITRGAESGAELPDVDALNAFLMRLKTGMNANPRFVANNVPPPNLMDAPDSVLGLPQAERQRQTAGGFESTPDLNLYGAFAVPLLHGWLPEPGSLAEGAFRRSAQTYEDAQALQFNEEELDYKLTTSGLSPQEQTIWEDINSIKAFLQQFPTQLTPYGLEAVQKSLPSGSFAIMFRNDHFSTVYKHPQSGQIFTLITDSGYAERDEIIWESLVDISGADNNYFSGDFRFVSHEQAHSRNASGSGAATLNPEQHLSIPDDGGLTLSPQEQQEQHDADFAMALQLQEEEEQRERAANARRGRSGTQPSNQNRQSPRGSTTSIPITLASVASRSDTPDSRPVIPPRGGGRAGGAGPPAVNRPSDALEDDAPPAYEEAAKGRPYIPPVGSPLHPTYSSEPGMSANGSTGQLTGTISNISGVSSSNPAHPPGPNAPFISGSGYRRAGMARTRSGGYVDNSRMPGQWQSDASGSYGGRAGRNRLDEERECIIM